MPTIDESGHPETRAEMIHLLDVCRRLAGLQHRIAGNLHTLGLLDDTTRLAVIAQADQVDASIDQARKNLITDRAGSDTVPHRIPATRLIV